MTNTAETELRRRLEALANTVDDSDWDAVVRRAARASEPAARADARSAKRRRPRRAVLALALAAAVAAGVGAAVAATTDILQGPPAAPENEKALRELFPPLDIGPATELTSHGGRTLFGARTRAGGYCFSATSPIDPKGEGGHCVSDAEAAKLDRRGVVAVAMSGWSVGGYAPGAEYVRVTGAGLDVEIPVSENGWWIGVAKPLTPLPEGIDRATVTATAYAEDGTVTGRDPLLRLESRGDVTLFASV